MIRKILLVLAWLLAPSLAWANCGPFPILDGGGVSTNFASATDGSSNCFLKHFLIDSGGNNAYPNAAALASGMSNPTTILLGAMNMLYNGTTWDRWASASTGVPKTDLTTVGNTAVDTNSGNKSAGTQRMVLATDQPNLTTPLNTNTAQMNGVTVTMGNGVSGTGVQRVTVASDSTGQIALAAGTAVAGKFGVDQTTPGTTNAVQGIPGTSGGNSLCYLSSAGTTNSTSCKGSAGQVYGYAPLNTNTTTYYLRMYNSSSAPTCSSATGFVRSIPVPAASATGLVGGVVIPEDLGEAYGTGIGFCLTGGGSSTDNSNAATGIYVAILYK